MATNDFDTKGYLYLKDVLSKDRCAECVQDLRQFINDNNISDHDEQVGHAHSAYGFNKFDKLLEDLLPAFEKATGLRLLPTYSFARLYKNGSELHKHKDRPACEVSATLTLGFEGDPWAIFMEGSKFYIDVGDAVVYKGCEIEHWREQYTQGEWQAQVFLHYVDADGPHADQKYDGRRGLGVPKDENFITDCAVFQNHLSDNFCNNIIETYSQQSIPKEPPRIGDGGGSIDKSIRDTERVILPQNVGIGATLTATGLNANNYWWKYHITHSNQTELLIYKPDGHYNAHVDTFHQDGETRKLTVLGFMNDDYEGGKFFLNANGSIHYPPQTKGTVLVFPSYMVHGVEPVTKGTRYSCVTWLIGPYFK